MQKIQNIIKSPIFLVVTSLVIGALMVGSAYYFTFQTKQVREPEIFESTPQKYVN